MGFESKLGKLLDAVDHPVVICDDQRRIVFANEQVCRDLEWTAVDLVDQNIHVICPDEPDEIVSRVFKLLPTDKVWRGELILQSKSNKKMTHRVTVKALEVGGPPYAMFSFQAESNHQGHLDKLTGLPSRSLLVDRLQQAI